MTTYLPHLQTPPTYRSTYIAPRPAAPVRLSIVSAKNIAGNHRLRFNFDGATTQKLARGLKHPRLHIEGDVGHGLRIYCREFGGLAPVPHRGRSSYVSVSILRVGGRQASVPTQPVDHYWDQDECGPVLVVPRAPDMFLPQGLLDKLPKSQLEPKTVQGRAFEDAERRLEREMAAAIAEAKAGSLHTFPAPKPLPDAEPEDEEPDEEPEPEPEPESIPPSRGFVEPPLRGSTGTAAGQGHAGARAEALSEPEPATVADVAAAVQLLNELIDRVGEQIHLSLDGNRLRAQRRVVTVSYVDL